MITLSSDALLTSDCPELLKAVTETLTFINPLWIENKKMKRWQGNTRRLIQCYRRTRQGLSVPRGFMGQLISMAKSFSVPYRIIDQRRSLPDTFYRFDGFLKPFQRHAVDVMLKKDFGILAAPTGSGKTVMALAMIAERKQPVLIIVHSKELLNQWIDRISAFLAIPEKDIGIMGAGKKTIGNQITVGIVNTIYQVADEIKDRIGFLVVDECHRTPARTFTEAVSAFDCKYMLGLSATPWRRDNLTNLIYWYMGDLHHKIDQAGLIESGDILQVEVITRETAFIPTYDPIEEYTTMLSELTEDKVRNALIAGDIVNEAKKGDGVCLILTDRKEHCRALAQMIGAQGIEADILTGDLADSERQDIIERLNKGRISVLIATGQLIGEGFDCSALSTLFLTTPVKFDGRLLQYLGRVLRPGPGRDKARVYDYVDVNVGPLKAQARSRARVYTQMSNPPMLPHKI
ncbi:MAG: DEAD/DEAH box helicase [Deltaproteobacteria bacterium]|nr:DEAD/DEAH box helicase [Deltaproteobacteria bacterium]